jgi:methanogenic corrinoid protein MtbC1
MGSFESAVDEALFLSPSILSRSDVAERRAKLAQIVVREIVPRLMLLHREVVEAAEPPTEDEIAGLARLVLSAESGEAARYITLLRDRGLPMERLFVELLEPCARHLGVMWDRDECDFIDVTLGLGRLQKLLAVFNATHVLPALDEKRRVLMLTTPGDQHVFGLAMVTKFLDAGGWRVESEIGASPEVIDAAVGGAWYAVAGLTLGSDRHLPQLKAVIARIRQASLNPAIGIMVGGPSFTADPALAAAVGADAMAVNAPAAVLVAQKLFDLGALRRWAA